MAISGSQKAYLYALSNIARSGATRSGYVSGYLFLSLGGNHLAYGNVVGAGIGVLIDGLTITDTLDEVPNRCAFRIKGSPYVQTGTEVIITLGSKNNSERLFAGYTLDVRQVYVGDKPANVQAEVSAVDYTWLLGFVKVTGRYTNQSASTIATDLVARYGAVNGFTAANVVANLPTITEITYTEEDLPTALTRLARRVGAYWYVDYQKDVHFFQEEIGNGKPVDLTPAHPSLADFVMNRDRSQVLTRVYVEGRGTTVLAAVGLGETRIPVEAVDMFAVDIDVFAKVSFQGSDGGAQHLNFSGVVSGGAGAIVGPGIAPTGPLTAALATGTGIDVGKHDYAYTWVTASGETKPSPLASVTHLGAPTTPTTATTAVNESGDFSAVDELTAGAWKPGDTVDWAYSYARSPNHATGTPISPTVARVATTAKAWYHAPGQSARGMLVGIVYSADAQVTDVYVWHRVNGGAWRVWATLGAPRGFPNNPGAPPFVYPFSDPGSYSIAATPPVSGTPYQQTLVTGIAVGPATVTARKIYRTVAGGAQLKLQLTVGNNTVTGGMFDTTPDASLGANAPAADTSALPQVAGTVLPGSSPIIVTSTAAFDPAGGWAIIGNGEQVIRYTGLSGNALNVLTAGQGALVAPVSYGATITAAPMLTGIPASGPRSLSTRGLTPGDELYLVVQRDNLAAQPQLATTLGVGNGIREEWLQDRRLSIPEARARGDATLSLHQLEARGVTYTCRDTRTAAGKMIYVNLPLPTNVTGEEYRIQQVTISNFRPHANQYPTYTVEASLTKFSFEDWLRRLQPVAQE